MVSVAALLPVVAVVLAVGADPESDNTLQDISPTTLAPVPTELVKQMLLKKCAQHYSMSCMKLDIAKMLDRLCGSDTSYQLLPGVSLSSHNSTPSEELPEDLAQDLARDQTPSSLDDFLVSKVSHYLGSLTLSFKLGEPASSLTGKGVETEEGRRKRNRLSGMLAAGLFSGGTLMALGLSALAALAGKALMTALLSLALSGLAAFKGSGDSGHKSTTYEIITKPVVTHAHTHSAEVQHEHGGHHAYAYARSMEFNPVLPVGAVTPSDLEDSYILAYRAQKPATTTTTSTTTLRKPIEEKHE